MRHRPRPFPRQPTYTELYELANTSIPRLMDRERTDTWENAGQDRPLLDRAREKANSRSSTSTSPTISEQSDAQVREEFPIVMGAESMTSPWIIQTSNNGITTTSCTHGKGWQALGQNDRTFVEGASGIHVVNDKGERLDRRSGRHVVHSDRIWARGDGRGHG